MQKVHSSKIETSSASASAPLVFSKSIHLIFQKRRKTFFFTIPLSKQIVLLKFAQNLPTEFAKTAIELSEQLNLPLPKLMGWLHKVRNKPWEEKRLEEVSADKVDILNEEFELSPNLTENRALFLSHVLHISVEVLRQWFRIKVSEQAMKTLTSENVPPVPTQTGSSNLRIISKQFTAEQYNLLMEQFKVKKSLTKDEVEKLGAKAGLISSQVLLWFEISQRKMRVSTMNQILQNLSKDLNSFQLIELERRFRKSVTISTEEAAILAETLNANHETVSLWFRRRRMYELYKFQGEDKTVSPENEDTRQILDTNDVNAAAVHVLRKEVLTVPNPDLDLTFEPITPTLNPVDLSKMANENNKIERITRGYRGSGLRKLFTAEESAILKDVYSRNKSISREEADELAVRFNGRVDAKKILKWFQNYRYQEETREKFQKVDLGCCSSYSRSCNNRGKVPPKSLEIENLLFEEFKKSAALTHRRRSALESRLNIPAPRIHSFFTRLFTRLSGKTVEELTKALSAYHSSFLMKLMAEYRKNRYISVSKCQLLAKQLGTSRRIVDEWFGNARLYEVLTKNKFSLEVARSELKKMASSTSASLSSLANSKPSNSLKKTAIVTGIKISAAKEQKLLVEFHKDHIMTNSRLGLLAKRTHINKEILKKWFKKNTLLAVFPDEATTETISAKKLKTVDTINESKASRLYEPNQLLVLFEAFKANSSLSAARVAEMTSKSNLSAPQVTSWFAHMRERLTALANHVSSEEYRRMNLTNEQIDILEREYQKHPYEVDKAREILGNQLGVTKGFIRRWFVRRRFYDILLSRNAKGHVASEEDSSENKAVNVGCNMEPADDEDVELIEVRIDLDDDFGERGEDEVIFNEDTAQSDNYNMETCSKADNDSLCCRSRFIAPLNTHFQLQEYTIDNLFWYVNAKPNPNNYSALTEEVSNKLEDIFAETQQPNLSLISQLSTQLNVSQQSVFWWFVVKRAQSKVQMSPSLPVESGQNSTVSSPIMIDLTDINDDFLKQENIEPSTSLEPIFVDVNNTESIKDEPLLQSTRLDLKKKKFFLSALQRQILMQEFRKSPYVSPGKARMLAKDLNLSVKRVEWWFVKQRLEKVKLTDVKMVEEMNNGAAEEVPLTNWQLFVLDREYAKNPKLTKQRLEVLSKKLRANRRQIVSWMKDRKNNTQENRD